MIEQPSYNQVPETKEAVKPRLGLTERVDQYYAEKKNWRELNGGCPISPDIKETLQRLKENVFPRKENLPAMISASISKYCAEGQTIEQIWQEKIQEGANFVGVVKGVFGFYRGEEKLKTNNKPLRVSAMPIFLEFHERERAELMARFRAERFSLRQSITPAAQPESAKPAAEPEQPTGEYTEGQAGAI